MGQQGLRVAVHGPRSNTASPRRLASRARLRLLRARGRRRVGQVIPEALARVAIVPDMLYEAPISPLIYGDFVEFLDELIPGMRAEKVRDRAFEGSAAGNVRLAAGRASTRAGVGAICRRPACLCRRAGPTGAA